MSVPTSAQLVKLRNPKQATKLYLSVYQPSTVLACQVNDASIAKGTRSITFDTVSAGSYLLVQNGMTMYVGTSAGAFDKGTIRVKSATSTVLTVAENSYINWADGDYLTVVSFFEINPVYPRIIQDPADEANTLWYKDYDVEYYNQNDALGTFVCMGSHYAGFIEPSNNKCQVYYSASGTLNLTGESLSYYWFFEGATVTGSNAHTPGLIDYTTPGHYTTRLTVSGTTQNVADVSYRHVSIYNRPELGTSVPILNWELVDLGGSRGQGGYTATVRIHQTVPETQLKDGSLIVIFSDDWYEDMLIKQSIGGNALNRSSTFFVGYVLEGSIFYNYRNSYLEFRIGSPTEIMKTAEGFSVSVRDGDPSALTPDDPSGWVVIKDLDIRRAIYHYLRWHSTVLKCCDFQFKGTDRPIQYFDADRTSLFDAVNNIMDGAFAGSVACDRQGKFWAERDVWIEPTAFDTQFTINKSDWIGDPAIEEMPVKQVSYLEAGGVAYDGTSYQAILAAAPGTTPGYRGRVVRIQGLALNDQDELNTIVGNMFAQENSKYPSVDLNMAGSYRCFDIAPQEKCPMTVGLLDTARGISFSGKNFYPETIRYTADHSKETLMASISFKEVCSGEAGDTLVIPALPPEETPGYTVPPLTLPPISYPPFPVINMGSGFFPCFVHATSAAWLAPVEWLKQGSEGYTQAGGTEVVDGFMFDGNGGRTLVVTSTIILPNSYTEGAVLSLTPVFYVFGDFGGGDNLAGGTCYITVEAQFGNVNCVATPLICNANGVRVSTQIVQNDESSGQYTFGDMHNHYYEYNCQVFGLTGPDSINGENMKPGDPLQIWTTFNAQDWQGIIMMLGWKVDYYG